MNRVALLLSVALIPVALVFYALLLVFVPPAEASTNGGRMEVGTFFFLTDDTAIGMNKDAPITSVASWSCPERSGCWLLQTVVTAKVAPLDRPRNGGPWYMPTSGFQDLVVYLTRDPWFRKEVKPGRWEFTQRAVNHCRTDLTVLGRNDDIGRNLLPSFQGGGLARIAAVCPLTLARPVYLAHGEELHVAVDSGNHTNERLRYDVTVWGLYEWARVR